VIASVRRHLVETPGDEALGEKLALKAGSSIAILGFIAAKTDGSDRLADREGRWDHAVGRPRSHHRQSMVTAYRWVIVMKGVEVALGFWPALRALYVALALNQCLPSYVGGDAYRIYWVYRQGHRFARVLHGVLIDRVGAMLALMVMLASSIPVFMRRFHDPTIERVLLLVLGAGVLGILVFCTADLLPTRWRHAPVVRETAALSQSARRILLTSSTAWAVGPLAVVVHCLTAFVLFIVAVDLDLPVSLIDCLLLVPPITLLSALPISVGGWGVREGVMVGALSLIGVGAEQALAVSVLLGFVLLANGMLGLLPLAFGRERMIVSRARREGPTAAEEDVAKA
jgi:uncharacterized membrane protein YbhN (UPF0104 family)